MSSFASCLRHRLMIFLLSAVLSSKVHVNESRRPCSPFPKDFSLINKYLQQDSEIVRFSSVAKNENKEMMLYATRNMLYGFIKTGALEIGLVRPTDLLRHSIKIMFICPKYNINNYDSKVSNEP